MERSIASAKLFCIQLAPSNLSMLCTRQMIVNKCKDPAQHWYEGMIQPASVATKCWTLFLLELLVV